MRHAILGAGGVGGLLGATLARAGSEVVLLMRPETFGRYGGRLSVESARLGDFEVDVPAATGLAVDIDVLWVTTKATQLEAALRLAPLDRVGSATVVPLLNGVDHVAMLRTHYPNVVAGAIRVESERLSPSQIRHNLRFFRVDLAGGEPIAAELRSAGIDCHVHDDELSMLWEKLSLLGPIALATTALDGPLGAVREDERYVGCREEAFAVARAEGARLDDEALRRLVATVPDEMRSSMQKDVEARRAPELDAIAGPIQRGGRRHGVPVPNTDELVHLVRLKTQDSPAASRKR
jgi:2-dehydropantoate 2-reductase